MIMTNFQFAVYCAFTTPVSTPVQGVKNGYPSCIVVIRCTHGYALVGDPARAIGECRDVAKSQP